MTGQQLAHVEDQLVRFIDRMVDKGKKATPAEIAALPEVTLALAGILKVYPPNRFSQGD